MKRALPVILTSVALALVLAQTAAADSVDSLSRVFAPGRALLDTDGDGFPDKPAITIIIPDKPTAGELALAADIAARANFESLAVEFGLVRHESDLSADPAPASPILIGRGLSSVLEALKGQGLDAASIPPNQGRVFLLNMKGRTALACAAGSDDALLKTGRAFFLRWPYFWEIWGRESGATYENLETDLASFLSGAGVALQKTIVREAVYEFPAAAPVADGLKALAFDQGQILNLAVEIHVAADPDRAKAAEALLGLAADQRRGRRTEVLSYPAVAALTFEISFGAARSKVGLPRTGATKRLLTPAFKERPATDAAGKDFDLLGLFSAKGVYADQDRDGIPDALEAVAVVPADLGGLGLADLTSRLVLGTAGASFPLVELDSDVESRKGLAAPILIGGNALTGDLVKSGRVKLPALEPGSGLIKIVPKAFGRSSALVVHGADGSGLDRTLAYLSRTFPFFAEFGEGNPQLSDLAADVESFLAGGKGAAEAAVMNAVEKAAADMKGRALESVGAEIILPEANAPFEEAVKAALRPAAGQAPVTVTSLSLKSGRTVFESEKAFTWEVDDAKARLKDMMRAIVDGAGKGGAIEVSIGVSESPTVREKVRGEIKALLASSGFPAAKVEVASAYKPGFFWLLESVLPALKGRPVDRLTIRFAEAREDFSRVKRTYSEPGRWLQELYPVDEILARELRLPVDRIAFESAEPGNAVYRVQAVDAKGAVLLEQGFTPRTREIPLSGVLPEWGTAVATTGWVRVVAGGTVVCDEPLETDLEKFWGFYQKEVLPAVVAHIKKETGGEPTFSKQPYFKRLFVDLQASEPDYRIGLDEEIVSSLEAIHDEVYFDTLDLLRGITRFDPEDKDTAGDTSRSSAPGNVFPSLHPSLEGGAAKAKVVLEDWPAPRPQVTVRTKETGRDEVVAKTVFPALKPKESRVTELDLDGRSGRVTNVVFESDWDKEADYLAVIDIAETWRRLAEAGLLRDRFRYPSLDGLTLRPRYQTQDREERLPVAAPPPAGPAASSPVAPGAGEAIVATREIISPDAALGLVRRLAALKGVRGYTGGRSFEGREVPVLELFLPFAKYVSLPRLVAFKPTLQAVARQHANEVSSTSYLLRFAELLARDPKAQEALKKMNFVLEPVENPDGAALAYEMQKNEPFHSLHAGRYGALGVDMGYQTGAKPILPEAAVRTRLYDRWAPDIFLNLHGYPSHEWVQPFSNYTPYLFRDYWIPKGWFTFFRSVNLPLYEEHRAAAAALRGLIAEELTGDPAIAASNKRFLDRFERWAARWAPHLDGLEIENGLAIFAKRKGPAEVRMTPRTQTTFSEQTPELMDETATGDWLDFLCGQGLAYLRAHVKYLTQTAYPVVRIEEEVRGRTRITIVRGRPGKTGTSDK